MLSGLPENLVELLLLNGAQLVLTVCQHLKKNLNKIIFWCYMKCLKIFKFLSFVFLRRTFWPAYLKNIMVNKNKFCDISNRPLVYFEICFVEYLRRKRYFGNETRTTKIMFYQKYLNQNLFRSKIKNLQNQVYNICFHIL